uniref:Phosphatidic acid phosphatase type 2/haloperoxidase domain-containing protein n=1 Tax=Periophthalmus magnuspinnatus TaxID=409849 RepID=A0A3B4B664_9GOBI
MFYSLPILVSFVVSLYFLEWTDVFKPAKSGFTCHDRSLSLPYIEPTHEVIPLLMLLSLAFAGPAITVGTTPQTYKQIFTFYFFFCLGLLSSWTQIWRCFLFNDLQYAIKLYLSGIYSIMGVRLLQNIFKNMYYVLQLMTGSPAPYFLTVCKPNYTSLNVSCDTLCIINFFIVVFSYRKSFPSQHATLASFAAVYVSMYFNSTLTDSSKLLKPLLVFSFIISAIICGLTRIIQYKNHAVDVYLGFLLGGAIAVYLVRLCEPLTLKGALCPPAALRVKRPTWPSATPCPACTHPRPSPRTRKPPADMLPPSTTPPWTPAAQNSSCLSGRARTTSAPCRFLILSPPPWTRPQGSPHSIPLTTAAWTTSTPAQSRPPWA